MSGPADRLNSWKEIAAHVGRDIRTVMRWEKERGLPVHRLPGKGVRQPVFAYTQELDEWLRGGASRNESPSDGPENGTPPNSQTLSLGLEASPKRRYQFWHLALAGFGGALTVFVVSLFWPQHSFSASTITVQFTPNAIQGLDARNRVVWVHQFPRNIHPEVLKHVEELNTLVRIADLYGNGRQEVIVAVPLMQSVNPSDVSLTEIDCFSDDGKLLWSYVPRERFRFGNYDLDGPWIVEDIFLSQTAKPTIWAALTHYRWGNSFVAELDPRSGKATVRFVNTGIIYKLNETRRGDKPYLLVGGFNNEYAAGMLAALDESKPYAVSPQTAGTRHKCLNCAEGAPDYYFVLPRSEINRLHHAWEDSVHFISVHENTIEIEKAELDDPAFGEGREVQKVHVVFDFRAEPTLSPTAFRFDSWYDIMHRDLEAKGVLTHTLDACPERLHPEPVREWTPGAGWTQIGFPSLEAVK